LEKLEGGPAIFYSIFWQIKAMGYLKRILDNLRVKKLRILIFLKDYLPGVLIELDGVRGEFKIESIEDPIGVKFDGALFGELKTFLNLIRGHMLSKGLWYIIIGKIKFKGIKSLFKFLRVLQEVAI